MYVCNEISIINNSLIVELHNCVQSHKFGTVTCKKIRSICYVLRTEHSRIPHVREKLYTVLKLQRTELE